MITGTAQIVGLIGWPVAHSLSPQLHNYWIERHGIQAAYVPFPIKSEHIEEAIACLPKLGIKGCNVTIPHKEQALALADEKSDVAAQMGAANTLVVLDNGKIRAENTDAFGFLQSVKQAVPDISPYLGHVMIVGAGGAARAVAFAMQEAGAKHITLANRTPQKAEAIASMLKVSTEYCALDDIKHRCASVTMLINTTSIGMGHDAEAFPSIEALPKTSLVCDIVYVPEETPLLRLARDRGNPVVPGIGMLLWQAAKSFQLWFGVLPQVDDALTDKARQWRTEAA